MTDPFDPPDWVTSPLDTPSVVDLDDDDHLAGDASAAVGGDNEAAARLGAAGVVAITAADGVFEVHETVDGWTLVATSGTPDVADLAMAARIRAGRLAVQRRTRWGPR